jgi:hypothetical protein
MPMELDYLCEYHLIAPLALSEAKTGWIKIHRRASDSKANKTRTGVEIRLFKGTLPPYW